MATYAGQMVVVSGTAQPGRLNSGTFSVPEQGALLTQMQGIPNGNFIMPIDGPQRMMAITDFSGVTSLNDVAGLIQAGLVAWAACVWNAAAGQFIISSLTSGGGSSVGFAIAGTGTNIGPTLRLSVGSGAVSTPGIPGTAPAQWVPCDGRHLHIRGRMRQGTTADYMRRVGFFGGGFGIKPWHLRVPRDYVGTGWHVSTQDNPNEPNLPTNTPTVMRPPPGVR